METRVLFVDDERSLLNGIERRLGDDYDITTAESGDEGLQAIQEHGPFPVIFTDMRMPRMDGVEFAKRGREIAPESTFVMLTGNQDQTTAVAALNQGRVFRFLNKPCGSQDLVNAIEDGVRQYELVTAEKELLQKTFSGAIAVLTDVIAMSHHGLAGISTGVEQRVQQLVHELGITEHWEFRLAAKLSPLGLALLSETERASLLSASHDSAQASDALADSFGITSRLIRDIPRLQMVADVCGGAVDTYGEIATMNPKSRGAIVSVGGTLLRIATHWELLVRQGLNGKECVAELIAILPDLFADVAKLIGQASEDLCGTDPHAQEVPMSMLQAGMVLAHDIESSDGSLLVRSGCRLTEAMLAKLQMTKDLRPIFIANHTALNLHSDAKLV